MTIDAILQSSSLSYARSRLWPHVYHVPETILIGAKFDVTKSANQNACEVDVVVTRDIFHVKEAWTGNSSFRVHVCWSVQSLWWRRLPIVYFFSQPQDLKTKPRMKCLIAVALLAVMVTYCSANTTSVTPSATATAGVAPTVNPTATNSSAAAASSTTVPPTSAEKTTTPASSGVSALPSVLVVTVAVLVAALK